MNLQAGPQTLYPYSIPIDPFKGTLKGTLIATHETSKQVLKPDPLPAKRRGPQRNMHMWEFPKIRGTLFWGPYNKDPT